MNTTRKWGFYRYEEDKWYNLEEKISE